MSFEYTVWSQFVRRFAFELILNLFLEISSETLKTII